jgi:hypothetical protein
MILKSDRVHSPPLSESRDIDPNIIIFRHSKVRLPKS